MLRRLFHSDPTNTAGLDSIDPKRILVLQLRQIGDVVLLTPSLRLLKRRFPDARIDVYTLAHCAPILENNPDVDKIWKLDRSMGVFESLGFYRKVGRDGYDMIVDLQQLPRCKWVVLFSDAPVRFTFPPNWYDRWLYTHWAQISGPYVAKCKAGPLFNAWNLEWNDATDIPRMYLTAEERDWARDWLSVHGIGRGGPVITLDPTHRRATRRWPAEHWGGMIAQVLAARPDASAIVLYGPGELADAQTVVRAADLPPEAAHRLVLPDKILSLRQMAAVIGAADLHVGNCSAPKHIASALDTPSITVRGATSPAWTCPAPGHEDMALGIECQPCNQNVCPQGHTRCLTDLAPGTVAARVLERLS